MNKFHSLKGKIQAVITCSLIGFQAGCLSQSADPGKQPSSKGEPSKSEAPSKTEVQPQTEQQPQTEPQDEPLPQDPPKFLGFQDLKAFSFSLSTLLPPLHLTPGETKELSARTKDSQGCLNITPRDLERFIDRTLPGSRRKGSNYSYKLTWDEEASGKAKSTGEEAHCIYRLTRKKNIGKGRPVTDSGRPVVAVDSRESSRWSIDSPNPDIPSQPEIRTALAEAWLHDARLEHSSIAEFANIVGELMALGAPPELIQDSLAAAQDELRHARMCYGLASAYGGQPQGPGIFPASSPERQGRSGLAVRTLVHGCLGETIASLHAAFAAQRCKDPVVQEVLNTIARDEEAHALLAWRMLAWLIQTAEEAEGQQIVQVLWREYFTEKQESGIRSVNSGKELEMWGQLGDASSNEIIQRAWETIFTPMVTQLLGAAGQTRSYHESGEHA